MKLPYGFVKVVINGLKVKMIYLGIMDFQKKHLFTMEKKFHVIIFVKILEKEMQLLNNAIIKEIKLILPTLELRNIFEVGIMSTKQSKCAKSQYDHNYEIGKYGVCNCGGREFRTGEAINEI